MARLNDILALQRAAFVRDGRPRLPSAEPICTN